MKLFGLSVAATLLTGALAAQAQSGSVNAICSTVRRSTT